jgi:hypothetical protein
MNWQISIKDIEGASLSARTLMNIWFRKTIVRYSGGRASVYRVLEQAT